MHDATDAAKDAMIRLLLYENEKLKYQIKELEKAYTDVKSVLEEYKKKVEPE